MADEMEIVEFNSILAKEFCGDSNLALSFEEHSEMMILIELLGMIIRIIDLRSSFKLEME
jgi:hypothetical protein